jgi:hypothetical protein
MFIQFRNTVYSCLPHADIVADKYHVIRQANWMIRDVRIRLFNSDTKYREYKKYWKLIEREYHLGKKGTDSKSYVWDNEISFVRLNKGFKIGEQSVSSRSVLGIKHNETDTKLLKSDADYKFYVGQRLSVFFGNIGMGGTYGELELSLNGVKGSVRNGYSILTALKSSSTLGYGFQWSNTFENEYMDYNNYKGAIRSKVESLFRWTYELGRNWEFSPEISVKGEKYFQSMKNIILLKLL